MWIAVVAQRPDYRAFSCCQCAGGVFPDPIDDEYGRPVEARRKIGGCGMGHVVRNPVETASHVAIERGGKRLRHFFKGCLESALALTIAPISLLTEGIVLPLCAAQKRIKREADRIDVRRRHIAGLKTITDCIQWQMMGIANRMQSVIVF